MTSQPNSPPESAPLNIEVPNDLKVNYANFALIVHSQTEVILNFASILPLPGAPPKAQLNTRVVMTPVNAKMMLQALAENLNKYETQFGEIKMPQGNSGLAEQFFGHARPSGQE
jgi:hypothetical protein